MTMTRTDIHRPGSDEFDPENYDFFGCFDLNPEWGDNGDRMRTVNARVNEGWSFAGAPHGSGQCSHCGARIRYAALMGHRPTNTLLYIGETCLDNRFDLTKGEFQELRKTAALNRERSALAERREAFLAMYPEMVWLSYAGNIASAGAEIEWVNWNGDQAFATREEAVADYSGPNAELSAYAIEKTGTSFGQKSRMGDKLATLEDMWYKVGKYGDMSPNAVAYATKILGWISDAADRLAEREAASAALLATGVKVPTGRVVVEGEVVFTDLKEGSDSYGRATYTYKMIVLSDEGWKVYSTVPATLMAEIMLDDLKGRRVRFTATIEAKDTDPLFGFAKRPTKASFVEQV
jgi:hypothetical protein